MTSSLYVMLYMKTLPVVHLGSVFLSNLIFRVDFHLLTACKPLILLGFFKSYNYTLTNN